MAFALSSYLLGHFASLIGELFLDDLYAITSLKIFENKESADALYKEVDKLKDPSWGLSPLGTNRGSGILDLARPPLILALFQPSLEGWRGCLLDPGCVGKKRF